MYKPKWRRYLSARLSLLVLFIAITQLILAYSFKSLNPLVILLLVLLISAIFSIYLIKGLVIKILEASEDIKHQAIINERKRLGREFHDGIVQDINYLELKLKVLDKKLNNQILDQTTLEEIKQIKDFAIELNANARDELFKLRHFASKDLNENLQAYLLHFSKKSNLEYQLEIPNGPIRLIPEVMNNLVRIIQEVLTNSQKHGQAQKITINVVLQNQQLQINIQDDGLGFNPNNLENEDCHGLTIIKERAQEINGHLEIDSQQGVGTRVKLVVPFK